MDRRSPLGLGSYVWENQGSGAKTQKIVVIWIGDRDLRALVCFTNAPKN